MVQRKLESCCSKQQRPSIEQIVRNMEYNRLRLLIPALATRQGVPKIEVIEEAIKYIGQLQKTLADNQNATPDDLQHQFLQRERSITTHEVNRRSPSYLNRQRRRPKTMKKLSSKTLRKK